MKANYLPPGDWVPNDFTVGDEYVTNGEVFVVTGKNESNYQEFELAVEWRSEKAAKWGKRVWPNLQWVALIWEEST